MGVGEMICADVRLLNGLGNGVPVVPNFVSFVSFNTLVKGKREREREREKILIYFGFPKLI